MRNPATLQMPRCIPSVGGGEGISRRLNVKCGSERKMAAQAKIHTHPPLTATHPSPQTQQILVQQTQREF